MSFEISGWQSLRYLKISQGSEKLSVFYSLLQPSATFFLANKRSVYARWIYETGAEIISEVKICPLSTLTHSQTHEKKTTYGLLVCFVISKLAGRSFQPNYIVKYVKIIHSQNKFDFEAWVYNDRRYLYVTLSFKRVKNVLAKAQRLSPPTQENIHGGVALQHTGKQRLAQNYPCEGKTALCWVAESFQAGKQIRDLHSCLNSPCLCLHHSLDRV